MNIAMVVSYIYDSDYTETVLSKEDRDTIWTSMSRYAFPVFDDILFKGYENPLSFNKQNFGTVLNSGIIVSGLAFYEKDPAQMEKLIQRALGRISP